MIFRTLAATAMVAGTLALAVPAQAASPATGSVAVSANLTAVCYIGNGTLSFGDIATIAESGTPGTRAATGDTSQNTGGIDYVCSNGATATLSVAGLNDDGSQLQMADTNSNLLPYNIYTGSANGTPLTPGGTPVSLTADGTNKTITLYGTVPGATANQQIGAYSDTLTLSVAY